MARSTAQLRTEYAPACTRRPRGDDFFDAWRALDMVLRAFRYAPRQGETWGYNCRRITGGTGYSLHSYEDGRHFTFWNGVAVILAVAVDINSRSNPYGPRLVTDMPRAMVDAICAIRTRGGHQVFRWGGYYSGNKDAMHFEVVASLVELSFGIDWDTVFGARSPAPGTHPVPPTSPQQEEDEDMATLMKAAGHDGIWSVLEGKDGPVKVLVVDPRGTEKTLVVDVEHLKAIPTTTGQTGAV